MLFQWISWIRKGMQRLLLEENAGEELPISDKMRQAVELWSAIYRQEAPWLSEEGVYGLEVAGVLASELARMVTVEMESRLTGARGDLLNDSYQQLLGQIRTVTELACAKGGVCFKPYLSQGRIRIDWVPAEEFLPLSYDSNGQITGAAFLSRLKQGRSIFNKIEMHYQKDGQYYVENRVYRARSESELGREAALTDVPQWAELAPITCLSGIRHPLFSYFKMPFANCVDEDSPLGVSVFARAVSLLEQADRQYSRLLWEFEGGELAIDASADALRYDGNHPAGTLPKTRDRLFRGLALEGGDGGDFYQVFSPELRDSSLIRGLNEILIRIEDVCGFARGTVSHIDDETIRTATELKAMKQRTYALVRDTQKSLQGALEGLVAAMDELADLYQMGSEGECHISFDFDDSVVCDREQEFAEKRQLVADGIMQPWEFRAWYFGEDEATAKARTVSSL